MSNTNFQVASEMPYANNDITKSKAEVLFVKITEYLKSVKKDETLFFSRDAINRASTVYIPDIHGDFVHLIITLHRHGLLEEGGGNEPRFHEPCLHLRKDFQYVFLGDFYDRAPDADVIDFWLNSQIKNGLEIYRLIGNHEMAFLERNEEGYPIIFPSQDSIRDASNNFQITECLLKNIADGNILAAYVRSRDQRSEIGDRTSDLSPLTSDLSPLTSDLYVLYVHSYIINDDFAELGMDKNADIVDFTIALNKRFKEHGQKSYEQFLKCKKEGKYNWKEIIKPFKNDPLFDLHKIRNEMHTSFIWRRTGVSTLNIYPSELEVEIPDNVYQIVGHTPVFSFRIPNNQSASLPFVISSENGLGKVQFSDVGIGYYYKKDDFERPEVLIKI